MVQFLEMNFTEYIEDVRCATHFSEYNSTVGPEMCEMVSENIGELEKNINGIIKVLGLYSHGKIVPASITAFELFENMKSHLIRQYSGAYHFETYYRIRSGDSFPLDRKELFHIPYNKNYLVGTERYSMPGHPCLYLASQPELCWYECGKPSRFTIAKFDVPQEENNYLRFIDFSEKIIPLQKSFLGWFHNYEDIGAVRRYLLKHICTYPLRAACSVLVEHLNGNFIEEYIIPQLLLQWVLNDSDFDGIKYESCSSSGEVRPLGGHNIVLVTNDYDDDGYDTKLRSSIKVGLPTVIDIDNIKVDLRLKDTIEKEGLKNYPFMWGMKNISSDFRFI